MTPGHPTADLILDFILNGTAAAHGVAMEQDERELRRALAALSVFNGPGTFARNVAIELIRSELSERGDA